MGSETFRWEHQTYDISAILRNITSGKLRPIAIYWPPAAVKSYFDVYLDPAAPEPRPPLYLNLEYALSLPTGRLNVPVILVHVGDSGLIAYEEVDDLPRHVIADGNHRIALAASKGLGMWAFVLSRAQTEPYESIIA